MDERNGKILKAYLETLAFSLTILFSAFFWQIPIGSVSNCENFLRNYLILVSVLVVLVSLWGIIISCRRVSYPALEDCVCLLVMCVLIVLLLGVIIFTFLVTSPAAAETVSYGGYKASDYSKWLQNRFGHGNKHWDKTKTCLIHHKVCKDMMFTDYGTTPTEAEFRKMPLTDIQYACCKPAYECNFVYVGPTEWTKPADQVNISTNADCNLWDNDASTLCFNCGSCKAEYLDQFKSNWRATAFIDIVLWLCLVIAYFKVCRMLYVRPVGHGEPANPVIYQT